jgi:hypothetical protein
LPTATMADATPRLSCRRTVSPCIPLPPLLLPLLLVPPRGVARRDGPAGAANESSTVCGAPRSTHSCGPPRAPLPARNPRRRLVRTAGGTDAVPRRAWALQTSRRTCSEPTEKELRKG